MVRCCILLFLLFVIVNISFSQISKLESEFYINKKKFNNELLFSIGAGYNLNFNSSVGNNFMFSVDIIPRISRKFFLDFKLDAMKKGQSFSTIINIMPGYKITLSNDEMFSIYLGGGFAAFFYPGGHIGLDASAIVQTKLEYNLQRFFLNSEIRKPIFFSKDSGHLDLLLSVNFGIKM